MQNIKKLTLIIITGLLSVFLISAVSMLSFSYSQVNINSTGPSPIPSNTSSQTIDSLRLLITKRVGNVVTVPPRGLGSSDAFCHSDERITGGGYGSSSSGVRAKDVQIVTLGGDEDIDRDVQLVGGEKWRVNAYNDSPNENVQLVAQVYCAKLIR